MDRGPLDFHSHQRLQSALLVLRHALHLLEPGGRQDVGRRDLGTHRAVRL